ncbi:MFS transporter [Tengunoibacter tsumagoiensis]|uniref:MFS transporter n=2 Tax=Tengunoibacter tsumagoiensis TaxID=2014871 RepID=A0A402A7X8_9CHLR|nr:MFS transporter [Tengunoibacter tsumagoiensis]
MRKKTLPINVNHLLLNRNFALLWLGEAISVLGDAAFDSALALWVGTRVAGGQPWAPFAFSGVYLAGTLPGLLIGPMAGVFVDRWEKRHTMLIMDLVRALLILLLLFVSGLLPLPLVGGLVLPIWGQLLAIYSTVALLSTCGQFFGPSKMALLGDIVLEQQLGQASTLSSIAGNMGWLLGPALGSLCFMTFGPLWSVLINALSFVLSWLMIRGIHVSETARRVAVSERGHFLREFGEGLHFALSDRTVTTIIGSGMLFMLGVGALNTLYLFFLLENVHVPAGLYGFFVAVPACGAIVGSALIGRFIRRIGEARLLWLALLAWSGTMLVLARQEQFWPAVALLFCLGGCNAWIGSAIMPLLLRATPREMIGRVSGVTWPCMSMASMLSTFLAGFLSSTALHHFHATLGGMHFGFVDTIYTVVGLLALIASINAMRKLRTFGPEAEEMETSTDQKREVNIG